MRPGQDVLSPSRAALASEWVLANGIGGLASGSAASLPLHVSHAYLAASRPHGGRVVLLLAMEERIRGPDGAYDLAAAIAGGGLDPPAGDPGAAVLESFALKAGPVWVLRVAGARLLKSLLLLRGHDAVAIAYRHLEGPPIHLAASPLLPARPSRRRRRDDGAEGAFQAAPGRVRVGIDAAAAIDFWHDGAFSPARIRRPLVVAAASGGVEEIEALEPGRFEARLSPGGALHVIAAAEPELFRALAREDRLGAPPPRTLAGCVALLERDERERRAAEDAAALAGAAETRRQAARAHRGGTLDDGETGAAAAAPGDDPLLEGCWRALRLAATARAGRPTLAASLPAGIERTAEALRALRGLVTLRRFGEVRAVLDGYVDHLDDGLLPAAFDPADGTPRGHGAEPALWLAIAGELYARRSEDAAFAESRLMPALDGMLHHLRSGTRGVRVDPGGLLVEGDAPPRAALNALWQHAQIAVAQLARGTGRKESAAFHLAWALQHQQRFLEVFWDDRRGRLADAGEASRRPPFTPDQALALAVPSLLPAERALRLLGALERELLTPWGLRDRPGSPVARPAALGVFCGAYLKLHARSAAAQERVRRWLEPLAQGLAERRWPGIPEAFRIEGGEPVPLGDPIGTVAAAELLRAWIEEVEPAGGG